MTKLRRVIALLGLCVTLPLQTVAQEASKASAQTQSQAPPRAQAPSTASRSETSPQTAVTVDGSEAIDRKSTRLNSSHTVISYAVFCLKKKNHQIHERLSQQQGPELIID